MGSTIDRLTETLLWLCRVPSPIGEEAALADRVTERLATVDLAAPVRRYGCSLVVPLVRGAPGPHIGLIGHLDVVRTVHDAPPRVEGDKLYGAGAADMKSGLALMLDLAEQGPPRHVNLTLVFYAREEGPFEENELGPVLEQDPELRHVDLAVALEPSDSKLQLGCGGSVHAQVRFSGRTAHSSRPWEGANAIHAAAGLLTRLSQLEPRRSTIDGLTWTNVVSATLAQGGRARNVVPDIFELNLNHRFGPDTTLEQSEAWLKELSGPEAELTIIDRAPPAPPLRDHPLIQALAQSGVLAIEPKLGWTDVARFAQLGVPAVNFGPGTQSQAHQRNEWTSLEKLAVGHEILNRWLRAVPAG